MYKHGPTMGGIIILSLFFLFLGGAYVYGEFIQPNKKEIKEGFGCLFIGAFILVVLLILVGAFH